MELQDKLNIFGKYGCLALCYITKALLDISSEEESNNKIFMDVARITALITAYEDDELLDEECTVMSASKLMNMVSNKNYVVTKKQISSCTELMTEPWAAVRFKNGENGHWVLCNYGKIVYDSLDNSQSLKYGRASEARIIKNL